MKDDGPFLYTFGSFRLDPVKRILARGAETIALTSRAFDTLLVLLQNSGQTLEKDALLEKVWPGAAVEDNNLTQCISSLRKLLGEGRNDHRFIVTIPGRGYRFVADVEKRRLDAAGITFGRRAGDAGVGGPTNPVPASPQIRSQNPESETQISAGAGAPHEPPAGPPESRAVAIERSAFPTPNPTVQTPSFIIQHSASRIRNSKALWLAAAVFAVAVIALVWLVENAAERRAPQASGDAKAMPAGSRAMLAVLPFENLTGSPSQDYFSEGVTEEVITQLGRTDPKHLGVIARTSVMRYEHSEESVRQIAGELGVTYVIEGSVRRSGEQVRISAQLIRASDQTHLWAQSYQRPARSAFAVQEEVARSIQTAILHRLDSRAPAPALRKYSQPANREAYEAYLKGLYFFNRRDAPDLRKGVANFQQAVRNDPDYALAYAGLANCYTLLGLDGMDPRAAGSKAHEAALKAVALDSSLAEGHTALAAIMALYQWDWPGAAREFDAALSANPNYALAHQWHAVLYLVPQKRFPDAIAEMKTARELDPLSLIVNTDLGWTYFIAGKYDDALREYKKALDMDPHFVPAHFRLAQYYLDRKQYAESAREMKEDLIDAGHPRVAASIERNYQLGGYSRVISSSIQKKLETMKSAHPGPALDLAQLYSLDGRSGEAIQTLAAAYRRRDPGLIYLSVDPVFTNLRSDARFQTLERLCGLNP
ncbi:MAG: winged helix-turn-helix domain-containing protein [Terriglobia bacterium]